jgi:hypothetical protein
MTVITTIEMQFRIIDTDGARVRITTGGPLASLDAVEAMHEAVEAAQAAVKRRGFQIAGTGYGATSEEYV